MNRALCVLLLLSFGCSNELADADFDATTRGQVRVYYNEPGTSQKNVVDMGVEDRLVTLIESAKISIDFAAMGFTDERVIRAVLRANIRGVQVRFVGDARNLAAHAPGYDKLEVFDIPAIAGNQQAIMHNKFFVFDHRIVFAGTGNITPTDLVRNNNNFVVIDSPQVAADFTAEFEQLFSGRFGAAKTSQNDDYVYQVGDTKLEVYFTPEEDALGRITTAISQAKRSIHYYIFAFTQDDIGSAFIERNQKFRKLPGAAMFKNGDPSGPGVFGLIDRSQLHSNGPYHEAYRQLLFGVPMRLDGNDDSTQAGDYQGGGGRQHSKTMIIDEGTPDAMVLTGSFNWSSSATLANDENLLVLHGPAIAEIYMRQWRSLWGQGKSVGDYYGQGDQHVNPGDIVINEVQWDGYNGDVDTSDTSMDLVSNDEFIELLNTTDRVLDLSMFVMGTKTDFTLGLYPGTVIGPYERFLIVDHDVQPFDDLKPQLDGSAYLNPQFVMNTANDPRFLRLNLHNAEFYLRLVAPTGELIDEVGNGGPAFAGGRKTQADGTIKNFSMERKFAGHDFGDGTRSANWSASSDCNNAGVRAKYRGIICATPGEANSVAPFPKQPDPTFRAPKAGN
jgi:phosphatidylserine/phosphatidylglycerophosphate/cardiolipin synthase-like enzyme